MVRFKSLEISSKLLTCCIEYLFINVFTLSAFVFGDTIQVEKDGNDICHVNGFKMVEGLFGKEKYDLCVRQQTLDSSSIISFNSAILLDPDLDDVSSLVIGYPLGEVKMAYGYPAKDPASGTAEGYIGEDNHFYGVLNIGNRTFHADPHGLDQPGRQYGAFESSFLNSPERRRREDDAQIPFNFPPFHFRVEEHKPAPGIARSRICELLLLADKEFYERDCNSSLNHTVQRMMHAVAQADIIFRNADFDEDGVADNIGFTVKYILVLTSDETNRRIFGDLLDHLTVDGRSYLMKFARLRRLSEVCLGVAFSGHAFHNRTLGLSFTSLGGGVGGAAGGVCDRRAYGRSFNTLALAHAAAETSSDNRANAERVPERVAALTLAHEIGHSFGAHHDDSLPNEECRGYLMSSQSSAGDNPQHLKFSLCSRRLISAALTSMSYCLLEVDEPYCGNGIVEEGEACDCGLPARCVAKDPCCTPRAGGASLYNEGYPHVKGCSVAPSASCHPSQGLCCNINCQFANLTKSGIDCLGQSRSCHSCLSDGCACGLGGRCLRGECHAAECSALGLNECACGAKGPGGTLGALNRCGICCQLPLPRVGWPQCVGAEIAARAILDTTGALPVDWPGEDYTGPNVSISVCARGSCRVGVLRAWRGGDVCVAAQRVGVCSPAGACKLARAPSTNLYPQMQSVKFKRKLTSIAVKEDVLLYHIIPTIITVLVMK